MSQSSEGNQDKRTLHDAFAGSRPIMLQETPSAACPCNKSPCTEAWKCSRPFVTHFPVKVTNLLHDAVPFAMAPGLLLDTLMVSFIKCLLQTSELTGRLSNISLLENQTVLKQSSLEGRAQQC